MRTAYNDEPAISCVESPSKLYLLRNLLSGLPLRQPRLSRSNLVLAQSTSFINMAITSAVADLVKTLLELIESGLRISFDIVKQVAILIESTIRQIITTATSSSKPFKINRLIQGNVAILTLTFSDMEACCRFVGGSVYIWPSSSTTSTCAEIQLVSKTYGHWAVAVVLLTCGIVVPEAYLTSGLVYHDSQTCVAHDLEPEISCFLHMHHFAHSYLLL